MCGILGVAHFNNTPLRVTPEDFTIRLERMHYRGPDAADQWQHETDPIRLAHLRLSILDPRPEGTQPMHLDTCNGRYSMVFNGEVYNYLEIKSELEKLDYRFHTGTDSEVILAAYAAWGTAAIDRFNGMFSIAIYNDQQQKLFLLRDRLGVKPLYYRITQDGIVFGSEVKAIIDLDTPTPPFRHELIHQYMDYGYVAGEDTLHEGIKRLLPGHYLEMAAGAPAQITRYWSVHRPPSIPESAMSLSAAIEEGRKLFADALRLRLRSDVPVGIFLSGGLDSSAVVAMLSQQLRTKLKTFSVRYDIDEYGEQYDESVYAEQVAAQFNTDHHTYTMTASDFENYIPDFVRTMDEPVTEAAGLSLHFVSELAKPHVTVVLSGEGSDEIFAGYDLYQYMATLERLRKVATPLGAKWAAALLRKALPKGNKLRKYAELAALPFEQRYRGISVYDSSYQETLYRPDFKSVKPEETFAMRVMQGNKNQGLLSRMLDFDTRTWLVDDLLIKADRMSMGSSLELRVPFLDYRLVQFAASLPDEFKINKGEGKYLLKKMMEGLLPENIIYREKRGFPTPLARMFQGPLQAYVKRRLIEESRYIGQYFEQKEITRLCQEHFDNKADHHRLLWQLIILEEWLGQQASWGRA